MSFLISNNTANEEFALLMAKFGRIKNKRKRIIKKLYKFYIDLNHIPHFSQLLHPPSKTGHFPCEIKDRIDMFFILRGKLDPYKVNPPPKAEDFFCGISYIYFDDPINEFIEYASKYYNRDFYNIHWIKKYCPYLLPEIYGVSYESYINKMKDKLLHLVCERTPLFNYSGQPDSYNIFIKHLNNIKDKHYERAKTFDCIE